MRGDTCPFDHGLDPVVVEDSALEKMIVRSTASGGAAVPPLFDPSNNSSIYGQNPPPPGMESPTPIGHAAGGALLAGAMTTEGLFHLQFFLLKLSGLKNLFP